MKRRIYNYSSEGTPERLFDGEIDQDGRVYIVIKQGKKFIRTPWEDVCYQMEKLKTDTKR